MVEVNEDHLNENNTGYPELAVKQGVSHHHLHLADSKAGSGVEKLYSGEREDFSYALMGYW